MITETVNCKEAAAILGCSPAYVTVLIKKGVITTWFIGRPDGFVGKPGYRMEREEIEELAIKRGKKPPKKDEPKIEAAKTTPSNHDAIKKHLTEIQNILGLLSLSIEKLKGEL